MAVQVYFKDGRRSGGEGIPLHQAYAQLKNEKPLASATKPRRGQPPNQHNTHIGRAVFFIPQNFSPVQRKARNDSR